MPGNILLPPEPLLTSHLDLLLRFPPPQVLFSRSFPPVHGALSPLCTPHPPSMAPPSLGPSAPLWDLPLHRTLPQLRSSSGSVCFSLWILPSSPRILPCALRDNERKSTVDTDGENCAASSLLSEPPLASWSCHSNASFAHCEVNNGPERGVRMRERGRGRASVSLLLRRRNPSFTQRAQASTRELRKGGRTVVT